MIRITLPDTQKQKTLVELEAKPGSVAVTNFGQPVYTDDPGGSSACSLWSWCEDESKWVCFAGPNRSTTARSALSWPAVLLPPGTEISFTVGGG